ncbi:MAG: dihydrofolate reductase [Lysobacteraceae bacterium]|nr:MAG: dihydrofolate reductase [Xanthomonadaceae bacterium]
MRPRLAIIAAFDRHRAIGRGNALPWHLPDDLRRFRRLTMGAPVLMGRRTAESLGRALPGRRNLVLSRRGACPFAGMEGVGALEQALERCADAERLWVIGGGEVYAQCLPQAEEMYLTLVATEVADADAYFPAFDAAEWEVRAREPHPADARHAHAFEHLDLVRRSVAERAGGG